MVDLVSKIEGYLELVVRQIQRCDAGKVGKDSVWQVRQLIDGKR